MSNENVALTVAEIELSDKVALQMLPFAVQATTQVHQPLAGAQPKMTVNFAAAAQLAFQAAGDFLMIRRAVHGGKTQGKQDESQQSAPQMRIVQP